MKKEQKTKKPRKNFSELDIGTKITIQSAVILSIMGLIKSLKQNINSITVHKSAQYVVEKLRTANLLGNNVIKKRLVFLVVMMKEAIQQFLTDNCNQLAAAISYYLLLSIFPLALAAISVLSYFSRSPDIQAKVTQAITEVLPVSGDFVSTTIRDVAPGWGAASAIGLLGLLWTGTGLFNAVRKSLNTAWGIRQPRPFLRERLIEFIMMLGLGLFLLVYVGMTAAFNFIQSTNVLGGRLAEGGLFWELSVILTSIVIAFVGFVLLYEFIPNTRTPWRHVWVGALIAAVLFEVVKNVFIWFVGKFATYNLVYGSIGTIVALMTWTYISAVIVLFCAKLISIYPIIKSSFLEGKRIKADSDGKSPDQPSEQLE